MQKLMLRLWKDDCGALIATEWVFVATILVLGSITGLVAVRQAVISQFAELANAVMTLNQGYSFSGQNDDCLNGSFESGSEGSDLDIILHGNQVHTAGSQALDTPGHLGIISNPASATFIDQPPCD